MPEDDRIGKLEAQFTQMGNKLLSLEELLKKNNGDPDTRAKIDALVKEMDKMKTKLEAAGGTASPAAAAAVAAVAEVKTETKAAAVKKEKTFEEDAGLE